MLKWAIFGGQKRGWAYYAGKNGAGQQQKQKQKETSQEGGGAAGVFFQCVVFVAFVCTNNY